ncbi:MAG TPA: NAD(P)H-hydrate dehydratase [Burkholderiaceae bacterium]|nr:NAD(P)H-hydrate dehydratase [Burkholderiaceae bacterium]
MNPATFPVRIDAASIARRWPLFDAAASRKLEARAAALLPPHTLMQRAGLATARLALALAPHARHVWIVAGPGNNGGDGFEAAMHLARADKPVTVHALGDAARRPADAAASLQRAQDAGVRVVEGGEPPAADLDIDALLGIGGTRAPTGALLAAIRALNARPGPCLAVDVPSGLASDTGDLLGDEAVRATHTLALLTLKPGLLTGHGRARAGALWLDPIGCDDHWPSVAPRAWLTGADDAAPFAAPRGHEGHKGQFGDVIVVGGAAGMAGAVVLAARAALAAGAGRVFLAPLDAQFAGHDPQAPELMVRPQLWRAQPAVLDGATVVCGCGAGAAVREALPTVLSRSARLVLDADALNAIAADPALWTLLERRATAHRATVLTPHPLEAARLLGLPGAADVQADRLAAADRLATRSGAVVLLKGSGSVVAAPARAPHVNPTGDARLASAGTGDVLAGWLGGLWAATHADPFAVACAGAWQHGLAVEGAPAARALRAAALIERLAAG